MSLKSPGSMWEVLEMSCNLVATMLQPQWLESEFNSRKQIKKKHDFSNELGKLVKM